jgi:hypothetical protein
MANNKIFPKGIKLFPKNEKAPDFVIGSIAIDVDNIAKENEAYLSDYKGTRQLKLQVLMSKDKKPYLVVDTYKKDEAGF